MNNGTSVKNRMVSKMIYYVWAVIKTALIFLLDTFHGLFTSTETKSGNREIRKRWKSLLANYSRKINHFEIYFS